MKTWSPIILCVLLSCHFTFADDPVARQTDWTGGGGLAGPVESWGNKFESTNAVSWLGQPGRLALASTPITQFHREPVAVDADGAIKVYVSDIDLDGDTDILGVSYWGDRIELLLNDGGHPPQFSRQVIADGYSRAVSVSVADVDGDGFPDILGGADVAAEIGWWRNDGGRPPHWTPHLIDSSVPGAHDVIGGDLDLDGDTDVIAVSYEDDFVAWWQNDGGEPIEWTRYVIDAAFDYPTKVDMADLDGDGDQDVAASGWLAEQIVWWRNEGGFPLQWTRQVIVNSFTGSHWAQIADVDGDGRLDVLGAAMDLSTVAWWRNDGGDPIHWEEITVTHQLPGAVSVSAADLDGDGDIDVAASGWSSTGGVRWWENVDGSGTSWSHHPIDVSFGECSSVSVGDVDGNGTLDVLASSWTLNSVAWWGVTEPVEQGTLTSSILTTGVVEGWRSCGWSGKLPDGAEVRLSARASHDSTSMGDWVSVANGDLGGLPVAGVRYLQYRIQLAHGETRSSPVVDDVFFSWLSTPVATPRRPTGRVTP